MESETKESLQNLSNRLDRIEAFLASRTGFSPSSSAAPTSPMPRPAAAPVSAPVRTPAPSTSGEGVEMGRFLGLIAVVCFVLAASFLVKLSIDSGWLTPNRQVALALAFGFSLIAAGLALKAKDNHYASLLPGAGLTVLYLAVAGGHALYRLYPSEVAVGMASSVSVAALILFSIFRAPGYAGISVVGTYLSLTLFKDAQAVDLSTTYLLIWDITFAICAVVLRSRVMILLSAYLGLGLFGLWMPPYGLTAEQLVFAASIQLIQFLIFIGAVAAYAVLNRVPMTAGEATAFFPILLFFYGVEYSLLSRILPEAAPWISLGFAGVVYGVYEISKRTLGRDVLASSTTVSGFVSVVLLHALYFQILDDRAQVLSGLAVLGILAAFSQRWDLRGRHWPIAVVGVFVVIQSYVRTLFGIGPFSLTELFLTQFAYFLAFGGLYFGSLRRGAAHENGTLFLMLANGQFIFATYRLWQKLASVFSLSAQVTPFLLSTTWGVFAVGMLLWGKRRKDAVLAYSALGILAVATVKVFVSDISGAQPLVRILGLLVLGGILYFCGFQIRTIGRWTKP